MARERQATPAVRRRLFEENPDAGQFEEVWEGMTLDTLDAFRWDVKAWMLGRSELSSSTIDVADYETLWHEFRELDGRPQLWEGAEVEGQEDGATRKTRELMERLQGNDTGGMERRDIAEIRRTIEGMDSWDFEAAAALFETLDEHAGMKPVKHTRTGALVGWLDEKNGKFIDVE